MEALSRYIHVETYSEFIAEDESAELADKALYSMAYKFV